MITFELNSKSVDAYIELNKLLKATQLCESGAMANQCIIDQMVKLNGNTDTRKRAKIKRGDVVEFEGHTIKVV